jgi:hypothetical protein
MPVRCSAGGKTCSGAKIPCEFHPAIAKPIISRIFLGVARPHAASKPNWRHDDNARPPPLRRKFRHLVWIECRQRAPRARAHQQSGLKPTLVGGLRGCVRRRPASWTAATGDLEPDGGTQGRVPKPRPPNDGGTGDRGSRAGPGCAHCRTATGQSRSRPSANRVNRPVYRGAVTTWRQPLGVTAAPAVRFSRRENLEARLAGRETWAENPDASLAWWAKAPGRREAMWEPRAQNQTSDYAPCSRHCGKKPARGVW